MRNCQAPTRVLRQAGQTCLNVSGVLLIIFSACGQVGASAPPSVSSQTECRSNVSDDTDIGENFVAPRSKLSNFLIDLQLIESAAKDPSLIKTTLPQNKGKTHTKASISVKVRSKRKVQS